MPIRSRQELEELWDKLERAELLKLEIETSGLLDEYIANRRRERVENSQGLLNPRIRAQLFEDAVSRTVKKVNTLVVIVAVQLILILALGIAVVLSNTSSASISLGPFQLNIHQETVTPSVDATQTITVTVTPEDLTLTPPATETPAQGGAP
jgi:chemotaxis regulatin CheY-phosphate phosphatase CheZ